MSFATHAQSLSVFRHGDSGFVLIPERRAVQVDDGIVDLTPTEFLLLSVMVAEPGRAFRRLELMHRGIQAVVSERTVDVHVKALRRKLGEFSSQIETVRSIGYRLSELRRCSSRSLTP